MKKMSELRLTNPIVAYAWTFCNHLGVTSVWHNVFALLTNRNLRPVDTLCKAISIAISHLWKSSHCHDVRRTSLVCFLVFCAPCSNDVSHVVAFVLDLSVIAHRKEVAAALDSESDQG